MILTHVFNKKKLSKHFEHVYIAHQLYFHCIILNKNIFVWQLSFDELIEIIHVIVWIYTFMLHKI